MPVVRLNIFFVIGTAFLFINIGPVVADIYRYQDKAGVWHFTNVKTDRKYSLYLRSYKKKSSQYIKDYEGIITQASRRFSVDPSLIKAVIKAESGFNHKAVSHKGAQGLMQLMPKTSSDMKVKDPFNPEENIFGGTRYLSLMLQRYNSDKVLALAAYNAGPKNVATYQGVPPFNETETFIKRVLLYYNRYRAGVN